MMHDVVIAGAGFSGCTAARALAGQGKKVLLLEKRAHTGGNCFDFKNELNITIQKYGPHIFHTNREEVWTFLNRFSEFNNYEHKVLSYRDGKFYPVPINKKTICDFFGLDINTANVAEILKNEVEKSSFASAGATAAAHSFESPQNFEEQVISQVGKRLYEAFFKNYTMKQWGKDPKNLSADIAKRVPVRDNLDDRYFGDKYQGIPENGFTRLFVNMLDHPNIDILLNTDYFDIKLPYNPDLLVYTGELDRFFDYKYGKLEYRSLEFKYKNMDKEKYQPAAVVNYPGDEAWTRITEYKQFLDEKSDKTTLCYEYPTDYGEPYYVIINRENLAKRELYMLEAKKLEEGGNFIFAGRLAEYKYYNIDQAVESAILKINSISP